MRFPSIEARVAAIRAPLRLKLQVGFLVVIAVLLATGVASFLSVAAIRRDTVDLNRMEQLVQLTLALDHSIVLQEHLSSMFLLTVDESYSEKLVSEDGRFREFLAQLGTKGASPEEIAGVREAFGRYEAAAGTVRRLRRAGEDRRAQEIHVAHEHTIAHDIEKLTKALVGRMRTLQEAKRQEILATQRRTAWTVAGVFVFSVALALALGSVLARSVVHPVARVDAALERIAQGEFVTVADVANRDELGSLVSNVNRMSQRLADLYARERRTAQALQDQLAAHDQTQAQLRQAQKMEAVGRLAGGIAHDFNNLLTVIGGHAGLLLGQLPPAHAMRRHVEMVRSTTDRASNLTRQLLAFSRTQLLQPQLVDLNGLVEAIVPMLQRLIGEHVDLVTRPGRLPGRVKADPSQIEQVVLNLAVNARDAMPHGGTLTIATRAAAPTEIPGLDVAPVGPGVCLEVRDTGVGMSSETQAHVFEPFFTTKEPGKGTGLGLAMVYGIVKQSDGHVWIASQSGEGTTVTIWLPRAGDALEPVTVDTASTQPAGGRETILLVEDEAGVREFAREVLESFGYTVLNASDGQDALRLCDERRQAFHLVVTDVVMPKLGGRELVKRLTGQHPGLKVLYMSGYALGESGGLEPDGPLLHKPFAPEELARMVRQVLDEDSPTPARV